MSILTASRTLCALVTIGIAVIPQGANAADTVAVRLSFTPFAAGVAQAQAQERR